MPHRPVQKSVLALSLDQKKTGKWSFRLAELPKKLPYMPSRNIQPLGHFVQGYIAILIEQSVKLVDGPFRTRLALQ